MPCTPLSAGKIDRSLRVSLARQRRTTARTSTVNDVSVELRTARDHTRRALSRRPANPRPPPSHRSLMMLKRHNQIITIIARFCARHLRHQSRLLIMHTHRKRRLSIGNFLAGVTPSNLLS